MICSLIQPNLWVGPTPRTDGDFNHLQSLKITAVLSLQNEDDRDYGGVGSERAAAARAGLVFENVPVKDFNNTELQLRLPDCVRALEGLLHQGHSVYVHCHAGITRSPTVIAAYLHWCCGWKLDVSLAHVKQCRPCFPIEDVIRHARWNQPSPNETV
jgi:atypical dual specificity phosphatase